jgi:hypothetical protein
MLIVFRRSNLFPVFKFLFTILCFGCYLITSKQIIQYR